MSLKAKYSLLLLLVMVIVAACDTTIPPAPPVTVWITAVSDEELLQQSVEEALTGTAQGNARLTETVLAQGGVTLTPSRTPTSTYTPTLAPTVFLTATRTPTPTRTPTATFVPLVTNTPGSLTDASNSYIRVMNAWRAVSPGSTPLPVDVYINDKRVARSVSIDAITNYFQVTPGTARITITAVDAGIAQADANAAAVTSLASTIVSLEPGGIQTIIVNDIGAGIDLKAIHEDPNPVSIDTGRIIIVQLNPGLPTVNVNMLAGTLRLTANLRSGQMIGPYDVPTGEYDINLNDVGADNVLIQELSDIRIGAQSTSMLVLLPVLAAETDVTGYRLITGQTARVSSDVVVRFVNASSAIGSMNLQVGTSSIINLGVGSASSVLPVGLLGTTVNVSSSSGGAAIARSNLGPWQAGEASSDKIAIVVPRTPTASDPAPVGIQIFAQDAQPSAINASLRFIHALPGAAPLTLQIRALGSAGVVPTETPWGVVGQAEYAAATTYLRRTPDVYQIRVVQSGTDLVIATLPPQQLIAGGIYDFIITPGAQTGTTQLLMLEPSIQIARFDGGADSATAVYEAVGATLTALAPGTTATATRQVTPTETRTPVPTNTPYPTNTPDVPPLQLFVNPAPPNTTVNTITVVGQNFVPDKNYIINIDGGGFVYANGRTNSDGTLSVSITLSGEILGAPGPHVLRICVDCTFRGANQEQYAPFVVASPLVTPTATRQP